MNETWVYYYLGGSMDLTKKAFPDGPKSRTQKIAISPPMTWDWLENQGMPEARSLRYRLAFADSSLRLAVFVYEETEA